MDVRRLDAVVVLQDGARPDVRGELILGDADLAAFQVRGLLDAVGAHIDRGVSERARHEGRHAHIGEIALRGLHRRARQRQLADVELGMAERAEEDLLRLERHEHRIDAVDLHRAVGERARAVVIAHRDRQIELGHAAPADRNGGRMAAVDAGNVRSPRSARSSAEAHPNTSPMMLAYQSTDSL